MAKKTKEEVVVIDAVDIAAKARINIVTNPNANYSLCAFGTEFINWKNYIESDIEEMKKNFMPKIGTVLTDNEGIKYRFTNIHLENETEYIGQDTVTTPVYVFDLCIIQE
jgi:hypothetical protein